MPQLSLTDLGPLVSQAATEFGVPEDSLWRKIRAENSGSVSGAANLKTANSDATSYDKNGQPLARGIMQVTQSALDDVIQSGLVPAGTKLDGLSPADQIRIGAAYTKRLRDYSTDPAVEDAMYNFGPKARFQMGNLPNETQMYLKKAGDTVADSGSTGDSSTLSTLMSSKDLLTALLGNNTNQNANIQQGATAVAAIDQAADAKRAAGAAVQQTAIDGAASVAGQQAQITFQQNQLQQQLQAMFNLDPSQAGNEISTSLATAQQAKDARVSARAEYDQAASVSPLDDPIQYLLNQIQLPSLAAKNNALADAEDTALDNIKTKTAMLAASRSTLVANTADQQKQLDLDKASVTQKQAQAELDEKEAGNLTKSATEKLQLIGLVDKMGDNARSTIGTVISLGDREDNAAFRQSMQKAANDKKQLDAEDEARLNSRLKLVSDSLGLQEPMTMKRLRTLTNKQDQQTWLNAADTGQMGSDLQGSLRFYMGQGSKIGIQNQGGASTYLTAGKLAQAGQAAVGDVENAARARGQKINTKDAVDQAFQGYQDNLVSSMRSPTDRNDLSSPKWNSTYNPYVAPFVAFNGAIASQPQFAGLKDNSVTTAISTLTAAGAVKGENLTSQQQQQIFDSISQQVSDHKITAQKAAADISTYITAATVWNRQTSGYTLFGLPNQDAYVFSLDQGAKKVDLMNPTTVENYIAKKVSKSAVMESIYNGSNNIFGNQLP